jgi:hypothetical protein
MADRVVDRADEERLVVAAAPGEGQCRKGERTAKGTLVRTTGLPGLVACTNETESRYCPGKTRAPSWNATRIPGPARPLRQAVAEPVASRTSRAR